MIPKIYVAGPSKELERCQKWIAALEQEGFHVTFDWTKSVEEFGSAGEGLADYDLRRLARYDLRGIDEANLVWLLAPSPESASVGMWIEFGYALYRFSDPERAKMVRSLSPHIVVSPPISHRCLFAKLPLVTEAESDEMAFTYIQKYP